MSFTDESQGTNGSLKSDTARSAEAERLTLEGSETHRLEDEHATESLNDTSEQSRDPTEKLNDPHISERTRSERGRTNKSVGDVPASQAGDIPLVLGSVEAPGRSLERSEGKFLSQFKTMVRNLRRYKLSYGTIESLSGGRGVGLAPSQRSLAGQEMSRLKKILLRSGGV